MTNEQITELGNLIAGSGLMLMDLAQVERLSKDFYWYSPVLKAELDDKVADVIVQPETVETVTRIVKFSFRERIPLTLRGAGTGNYGQAIPLQRGIVLDFSRMNTIHGIENGVAECDPGVRLGALEQSARKAGWELRCYPSTWVKATVGGFLGGGSGGIGSITYGGLRENGTVPAIDVMTMEAEPRIIRHQGESVHEVLHSWGTNGLIVRLWLALGVRRDWAQVCATFPTLDQCREFARNVARDDSLHKRLVTAFEWPLPSYFTPIRKFLPEGQAAAFFEVDDSQAETLKQGAIAAGGTITFYGPHQEPRRGPFLSDYTWNHTTLWALKGDPSWTYLQCGFSDERLAEQIGRLKKRYGADFLMHIEYVRSRGAIVPAALPVVRFTTKEDLWEMIRYCEEIGVSVSNPHVNFVEGGGRYHKDNIQLQTKYRYDKLGLLNPGKMSSFKPETTSV
ncbi:MAG TPA: FAD-binding oxidoreductase [Chthoniobacterales bacterium]